MSDRKALASLSDVDLLSREVVADAYNALLDLREDRGWRRLEAPSSDQNLTYEGLKAARDESRQLLHPNYGNTFALGASVNRQNYAVGAGGLKHKVVSAFGKAGDAGLIDRVQAFVDLFCEANRIGEMELETVLRLDRDGEAFVRLFPAGGVAQVRFVAPERVVPYGPDAPESPGNHLGIRTAPDDTETRLGYNVDPGNGEPEEVPERRVVHLAVNTDTDFLRGWPTFQPAVPILQKCELLHQILTVTAQVRGKLAAVHKTAMTRQSADAEVARLTGTTVYSHAGTANPLEQFLMEFLPMGAKFRIPREDSIEFPSMNLGAADIQTAIQIGLRAAAQRVVMPEWMFSGQASEKYANSFVGEGPALRSFPQLQKVLVFGFGEGRLLGWASVVWRAVRIAVREGLLPPETLRLVKIKTTAPSLEARDKAAEAATNGTYVDRQVKSRQTIQEELGLDPEEETKRVDNEIAKYGQAGRITFGTGSPPPAGTPPEGGAAGGTTGAW